TAIAVLNPEVDLAGMGVLQEPGSVGLPVGSKEIDRLVHALVRRIADGAEVFEGAKRVVVPAGRKRELQPFGADDLPGALAPQELPFEEIFLAPASRLDGPGRAACCTFVRQRQCSLTSATARRTWSRHGSTP